MHVLFPHRDKSWEYRWLRSRKNRLGENSHTYCSATSVGRPLVDCIDSGVCNMFSVLLLCSLTVEELQHVSLPALSCLYTVCVCGYIHSLYV